MRLDTHDGFASYIAETGGDRFDSFDLWVAQGNHRGTIGTFIADKAGSDSQIPGQRHWWRASFDTFKAHGTRLGHYLAFPFAKSVDDLFEAARLSETPAGSLTLQEAEAINAERCGGPGFMFVSGTSAMGAAWCGQVGGTRGYDAKRGVRHRSGSRFYGTYARPRREVLDWWRNVIGEDGPRAEGSDRWGLSGFELVERTDGVLVIGRSGNSISSRWLALLPPGSTLRDLMPATDVAMIDAEKVADESAWPTVTTIEPSDAQPVRDQKKVGDRLILGIDVLHVLARAETTGASLKLTGKLDRKLYEKTDEALRLAGFTWNRRQQAHVCEDDAAERLDAMLSTGDILDAQKVFQAFYTPDDLAARVVAKAGIRDGQTVLEPSAGRGALALAARKAGAKVICREIEPDNVRHLTGLGFTCGEGDFLETNADLWGKSYDAVVMNPPFRGQADVRHVLHAALFVRPGGVLVAIMSATAAQRSGKLSDALREFLAAHPHTVEAIPPGAFAASGTNVATILVRVEL